MESANGTLKVECVHDEHFATREQAHLAIVEYIGYYNTERRHSSLGYIAPAEFERRWRTESDARTRASQQMSGTALPTDGRSRFDENPNRPSVDNAHRASWRPRIGDQFKARQAA